MSFLEINWLKIISNQNFQVWAEAVLTYLNVKAKNSEEKKKPNF